jgi:hypothetical protein
MPFSLKRHPNSFKAIPTSPNRHPDKSRDLSQLDKIPAFAGMTQPIFIGMKVLFRKF